MNLSVFYMKTCRSRWHFCEACYNNILWKQGHCLDEGAPTSPVGNFRVTREAITPLGKKEEKHKAAHVLTLNCQAAVNRRFTKKKWEQLSCFSYTTYTSYSNFCLYQEHQLPNCSDSLWNTLLTILSNPQEAGHLVYFVSNFMKKRESLSEPGDHKVALPTDECTYVPSI